MNCPHCKKSDPVPSICLHNVDNYGDKRFDVLCVHCRQPIVAYVKRVVVVSDVRVGLHNPDDCSFGMCQMFPKEEKNEVQVR